MIENDSFSEANIRENLDSREISLPMRSWRVNHSDSDIRVQFSQLLTTIHRHRANQIKYLSLPLSNGCPDDICTKPRVSRASGPIYLSTCTDLSILSCLYSPLYIYRPLRLQFSARYHCPGFRTRSILPYRVHCKISYDRMWPY